MTRNSFYLLVVLSLVLSDVSATKDTAPKPRKKGQQIGPVSKTDIPTAEQILGKLLGMKQKTPDQEAAAAAPVSTAPQTLPFQYQPSASSSQARSPYKPIFNSLPVLQPQGATPQTEDDPSAAAGYPGYPLPAPPPGYHYGRPRRKKLRDDEYRKDEGNEEEEEPPAGEEEEEDNPADGEYQDQRNLLGRGRGRNLLGRCRRQRGCSCICWKGIKPHVEWVRVPVCYRPCGVCCPKHEEQGACAAVCQPCCHSCCHCCCHHCPCHCCHCCHCCRRSLTLRPPLVAPPKLKKLKTDKKINKKNKIKTKKTIKKAATKATKKMATNVTKKTKKTNKRKT